MLTRLSRISSVILVLLIVLVHFPSAGAAELPMPATGGLEGDPIQILVVGRPMHGSHIIEDRVKKELEDAGYVVTVVIFDKSRLTPEYLKRFNVLIMNGYPTIAETFGAYGTELAYVYESNTNAIHSYVEAGGSLLFLPHVTGGGMGVTDEYNRFLAPYELRYIAEVIMDPASAKDDFATASIKDEHIVGKGLKSVVYPTRVLRWDHAYSNYPLIVGDGWTVIVEAGRDAGTYMAKDNANVIPRKRSANRILMAVRQVAKGTVAADGINSFYTFSSAHHEKDYIGEMRTGRIAGIVRHGEKDGRRSDYAKLMDRLLRYLGSRSTRNGFGGGTEEEPPAPPLPTSELVIDWDTLEMPPTWRHRVVPDRSRGWANMTYDEHPDPAVKGELKYFKVLIGPRTAYSIGTGTVHEWREAAKAAGYSAIMFAEKFEALRPEEFEQLMADCKANSDDEFVCVPGIDIRDDQHNRFLVLGSQRYPDNAWLTADGLGVTETPMFSLGMGNVLTALHRPGHAANATPMHKHFQGVVVYTYNDKGKLVDSGMATYQWILASDSNPHPIVAHELTSPQQVKATAGRGFQQILPSDSITKAISYFRVPIPLFFQVPVRIFVSEGPIIDGWSCFNKDVGKPQHNRDRYRMRIGVTSDDPLREVALYDGLQVKRRWRPNEKQFRQFVDQRHTGQSLYMLVATDTRGRRAISPVIRIIGSTYRQRCSDRQNWLGTCSRSHIYNGWTKPAYLGDYVRFRGVSESFGNATDVAPIHDYTFFGSHCQILDTDFGHKYYRVVGKQYGDRAQTRAVRPTDLTEGSTRTLKFLPKRQDFVVRLVETTVRLKRDLEPVRESGLFPVVARIGYGLNSNALVIPGRKPDVLATIGKPEKRGNRTRWKRAAGNPENEAIDNLPVGTYAGARIYLTPGLNLRGRLVGFPAPGALNLTKGTNWTVRFLEVQGKPLTWRYHKRPDQNIEDNIPAALRQMGLNGEPPYRFNLTTGKLEGVRYIADFTADDGGISGRLENPKGEELLIHIPMRIRGLNPLQPAAVWRSDAPYLDWFDVRGETGYVQIDGDRSVDFYAGNIVRSDPRLCVEVIHWTSKHARFRIHNPTGSAIESTFATVDAVKGRKPLKKQVTVPPGASLVVE